MTTYSNREDGVALDWVGWIPSRGEPGTHDMTTERGPNFGGGVFCILEKFPHEKKQPVYNTQLYIISLVHLPTWMV